MDGSARGDISTVADASGQTVERTYLWNGEFADPEMEADFRIAGWDETLERMRAIQYAIYVFAGWTVFDFMLLGARPIVGVVCVLRLTALFLGRIPLLLFSNPCDHKNFFRSMTLAQVYVFAVFLLLVNAGGVAASTHALSAAVIIIAIYFGVPNRLATNAVICAIFAVAFTAIVSAYPTVGLTAALQIFMLLVVSNIVGFLAMRVTGRLRRAEYLTLVHQKELNERLTAEIAVRQEAQRAVRATEESFHSIFLAAPSPLALIDPVTYRIMRANHAAIELFGPLDEDMTDFDARNFFIDEDARERMSAAATVGRKSTPFEVRLRGADDTIIWAHISSALIRFQGLPAFLVGLQDVTARRKEAEALREARDQATAANRSKSEFLANMSHELRTPLNAIIGFSEALERELFGPVGNPRYREYAEDIHDSGVHLLNLINDILDLSKIEAGHFKLHEEEMDLDAVVASACRIVRPRAQQAAVRIEMKLPTPPLSLMADERALKQILINLISNAVKFSDQSDLVRVEATVRPEGLRFAVIDHGIGIAEEDIPKALAPFTQIDGTLSRSHEGTGLGLPLAKHLTELHGGTLTLESAPGRGTTVIVDLPASRIIRRSEIQAV